MRGPAGGQSAGTGPEPARPSQRLPSARGTRPRRAGRRWAGRRSSPIRWATGISAAWVTLSGMPRRSAISWCRLDVDGGHRRGQPTTPQGQLQTPDRRVDRSEESGGLRRGGARRHPPPNAGQDEDGHPVEVSGQVPCPFQHPIDRPARRCVAPAPDASVSASR